MSNLLTALLLAAFLSLTTGCGLTGLYGLNTEDTASAAFCIVGSGPPMTGGGTVTGAKTNKDFTGTVTVLADCSISITAQP